MGLLPAKLSGRMEKVMSVDLYIYSGAVNGVLELLEEQWNIDPGELTKYIDVRELDLHKEYAPVPLDAFAVILEEAARLTGDDALTLNLAREYEKQATSLLHCIFRQSPSIKLALNKGIKYSALLMSLRHLKLVEADEVSSYQWSYWKGFNGMQQLPMWLPARVVVMMRSALGQEWFPEQIKLENGEPDNIEAYQKVFGPNVLFNQSENVLLIKTSDLNKALPHKDEAVWKYLLELSEKILAERSNLSPLVTAVRGHILNALPEDSANIKNIAGMMGKSPRTLQRDLSQVGVNFSQILDQTRKEQASKYLLDTDMHISQIAFLLGFSEVSVFTRAVRRWFNQSPSSYRQMHRLGKVKRG